MRRLALALLLIAAAWTPASAQSVNVSNPMEASIVQVVIPANTPTGTLTGYIQGCATGRVLWTPGTLAQVDIYGTDNAGGAYDAANVVAALTTAVPEPGNGFSSTSNYLRFDVRATSTQESRITLRCSNYFADSFSLEPLARARATQVGNSQTVDLSSAGSRCPGTCVYLWEENPLSACTITDPAAANTTATDCPYDTLLGFDLTVDNEFGLPDTDTAQVTLSATITGFPFTFPATLQ